MAHHQHVGAGDACRACTDCGSFSLVEDWANGDLICTDCGLVAQGHIIDYSADWINNAETGTDMSRVGAPVNHLFHDDMMSTVIPKRSGTWMISRLHDHMSMTYKDRALYKAYQTIQKTCEDVLHLPTRVIDQAKELYKDTKDIKITRGDNHKAIVACCVYFACKLCPEIGCVREKIEICDAFVVDKSTFTAACKIFQDVSKDRPYYDKLFEESSNSDRGIIFRTVRQFPEISDSRIWNVVRRIEDAYKICKEQSDGLLDSKTPHSIITSLIYIISERMTLGISKNDIKTYCKVSAVTLNKTIGLVTEVLAAQVKPKV
jgi:transcription initiation factor TFIIIB Brf1 subunit/transcription initiation factor TFIIB